MNIGGALLALTGLVSCQLSCELTAAELIMEDLTLALQAGPTAVEATVDNGSRTTTVDDGFAQAYGIRAGYRHGFTRPGGALAPLLGLELTLNNGDFSDGSTDRRVGALVGPGIGWAVHDRCTVLLQAVIGAGLERTTLSSTSAYGAFTADGWWWSRGLRAGALVDLDRTWLLGLEADYGAAPGTVNGDGLQITLRPSGLAGALVLVWRMDAAPAVLEH